MHEIVSAVWAKVNRMSMDEVLGAGTAFKVWSIPLLTQQMVFAAINTLGVYRWLIRKER